MDFRFVSAAGQPSLSSCNLCNFGLKQQVQPHSVWYLKGCCFSAHSYWNTQLIKFVGLQWFAFYDCCSRPPHRLCGHETETICFVLDFPLNAVICVAKLSGWSVLRLSPTSWMLPPTKPPTGCSHSQLRCTEDKYLLDGLKKQSSRCFTHR